jgi:hypothetical protein
MDYTAHEPHSPALSNVEGPGATPRPCSTPHSAPVGWLKSDAPAAQPDVEPDNPPPLAIRSYATRHDGWTGEKMAVFCETLAETAVVAEACDAARMGISGAYAARRRNPVFAAAWDAALTIARERLADTLLARSMEGNIEQIWRGGEIVGERHVLDNRLGLAILRRLDRLAETGLSLHSNLQEPQPPSIVPRSKPFDWERMVAALHSGNPDDVAEALALLEPQSTEGQSNKVEDVEDPLNRPPSPNEEEEELDLSHRCWRDPIDTNIWMTDFPPPEGFTGYESCDYGDLGEKYERICTPEEVAILDGDIARARAAEREEDEALRDAWFDLLRSEQQPDAREEADADSVAAQPSEGTGFGTGGKSRSSPSPLASARASTS